MELFADKLSEDYWKYKGFYNLTSDFQGKLYYFFYSLCIHFILSIEYELKRNKLKIIRIYFDTPVFDKVTMDSAAKFVDKLSAIGGAMGLLTGFSIISGVEIVYFLIRSIYKMTKNNVNSKY